MLTHAKRLPSGFVQIAFALAISPRTLPTAIGAAGANASQRFIEFFTANIRNSNTRAARARAMRDFLDWREDHGRELHHIGPVTSAGYIEQLGREHGAFFAAAS